jgi:hypothetical protein
VPTAIIGSAAPIDMGKASGVNRTEVVAGVTPLGC